MTAGVGLAQVSRVLECERKRVVEGGVLIARHPVAPDVVDESLSVGIAVQHQRAGVDLHVRLPRLPIVGEDRKPDVGPFRDTAQELDRALLHHLPPRSTRGARSRHAARVVDRQQVGARASYGRRAGADRAEGQSCKAGEEKDFVHVIACCSSTGGSVACAPFSVDRLAYQIGRLNETGDAQIDRHVL